VSRQQRRTDRAGGLTVLTEEEPIPKPALKVLKRGVAHKVAVLTVLQWAVSPASAVEGVVLHGDDVHDEGNEVPRQNSLGSLYPAEQLKHPQTCKQKRSGDWGTKTMSRDPTYPDIPEGSERGH
jgi:hypothetical protein